MNGTYLLADPTHEACIGDMILNAIRANLNNKIFGGNKMKFGVSTLNEDLFTSPRIILAHVRNTLMPTFRQKKI